MTGTPASTPAGQAPLSNGSATTTGSPPTPVQQLVHVLEPVRSGPQGTHQITLGLHPEELGTVKATVTVSATRVVVELSAPAAAARDTLRQAMGELRQQLAGDTGIETTVFLSDGEGSAQNPQSAERSSAGYQTRPAASETDPSLPGPNVHRRAADRLVDVHL